MTIRVNQLGEQIGAEVLGADVRDLDAEGFDTIYQAWLRYNVVAVRDQEIDIPQFLEYSRRFGGLSEHPSKKTRHPDYAQLTVLGVDKFDEKGNLDVAIYRRGAANWHTDGAYDDLPFKATQLYALAIPSRGGDTMFASMYAAYEALSEELKAKLVGRLGAFTYGGRTNQSSALLNPEDRDAKPAYHPILRVHPETGRTGLYFDPGKILRIEGYEPQESEDLIEALTDRMIQPDAQYRHVWRKGDIVIWDNRCSYHRATADYPPEEDRIHWRVSIKEPQAV